MSFDLGGALDWLDSPGFGSTRTHYESTPSYQFRQAARLRIPGQSLAGVYQAPPQVHLGWAQAAGPALPAPVAAPVTAPERFGVEAPFSGAPAPAQRPAPSFVTGQGPLGGLTDAIGDTVNSMLDGGLNIGNVVPWLLERTSAAATAYGDSALGRVSPSIGAAVVGLDALDEAYKRISAVAAPVVDSLNAYYRDSTLGDRAKVYADIVRGTPVTQDGFLSGNLLSGLASLGSFLAAPSVYGLRVGAGLPTSGATIEDEWRNAGAAQRANEWNTLVRAIAASGASLDRSGLQGTGITDPAIWSGMGGSGALSAADVARILAGTIDLPDGVKAAIENDPAVADRGLQGSPGETTPLARIIDDPTANPAGRQYSYLPGNELRNQLLTLGLQAPVIAAAVAGAPAFAAGLMPELSAGAAAGSSAARAALMGVQGAQKAVSLGALIQKGMLLSGATTAGGLATAQVIARLYGDENAIRWVDQAWRTHPLANDPNTALFSSIAVNPFAAITGGKVVMRLAGDAGSVVFDKATGGRFTHFYTSHDLIYERAGQMIGGLRGKAAIAYTKSQLLGTGPERFASDQDVADAVVGTAADILLDPKAGRIPLADIVHLDKAFPDPAARTAQVLGLYGRQIMDIIEKEPQALRQRFAERNWNYHGYAGTFDPGIALRNFTDYRNAQRLTYRLRTRVTGSVVGYVEALPPAETQRLREDFAARFGSPDDQVPVKQLNELLEQRPALRGTYQDLPAVRGKRGIVSVPRSTIDEMLFRADAKFRDLTRTNPQRAATGVDPILRPGYAPEELATALGTTRAVVDEVLDHADGAAVSDALRAFVTEKVGRNPTGMTPDAIVGAATDYIGRTSGPWVKRGLAVAAGERDLARAEQRFAEANAAGDTGLANYAAGEARRLRAELDAAQAMLPNHRPFASRLAGQPRVNIEEEAQLAERAQRKAAAIANLERRDQIGEELDRLFASSGGAAPTRDATGAYAPSPRGWVYTGGLRPVTSAVYRRATEAMGTAGLRGSYGEGFTDQEVWAWLDAHPDWVTTLSKSQRRSVAMGLSHGPGESLDSLAGDLPDGSQFSNDPGAFHAHALDLLAQRTEIGRTAFRAASDVRLRVPDALVTDAMEGRILSIHDPTFITEVHPANVARAQALSVEGYSDELRTIIDDDPLLSSRLRFLSEQTGASADELLASPAYSQRLRAALFPPEALPTSTPLDDAILADRPGDIAAHLDRAAAELPAAPIGGVSLDEAETLARTPVRPTSVALLRQLNEAGGRSDVVPNAEILAAHPLGARVLGLITWGDMGATPRSLRDVAVALREIERGDATAIGVGERLQAEAQQLAEQLLADGVAQAKRATFGPGTVFYTDPARWSEESFELAKAELAQGLVRFDPGNPLGLQYGLKAAPKQAAPLDFAAVPGLAEEFVTGRFEPYAVRIEAAHVRQSFGYLFGKLPNSEIGANAKRIFADRLTEGGVDPSLADAVWDAWHQYARASRSRHITKVREATGATRIVVRFGDNPLYANARNIPGANLQALAQDAVKDAYRGRDGLVPRDFLDFRYDVALREATSGFRRYFADHAGSLGNLIAGSYGLAAHNRWATTLYYWARFALDIRFHAMNSLEGPLLYLGRAALKPGTANDRTWLGLVAEHLGETADDVDPSYPFMTSRAQWVQRTYRKEQGPAFTDALEAMERGDPSLLDRASLELATHDPELSSTIASFGDTPEGWLRKMDAWHGRILDVADPEESVAAAFAAAAREEPALGEIYGRLMAENQRLITDIRSTFFGNPERSRVERVLNHYLLFWPLSYQLKAAKWLGRTLFEGVGGLPVNAVGAYALDHLENAHESMLKSDPAYARFIADHNYGLFLVSMLFPTTTSIGVTLNPVLRDLFFGRTKALWNIGPIYTLGTVYPNVVGELYKDTRSVPALRPLVDALTRIGGTDPARLDRQMGLPPPPFDTSNR